MINEENKGQPTAFGEANLTKYAKVLRMRTGITEYYRVKNGYSEQIDRETYVRETGDISKDKTKWQLYADLWKARWRQLFKGVSLNMWKINS